MWYVTVNYAWQYLQQVSEVVQLQLPHAPPSRTAQQRCQVTDVTVWPRQDDVSHRHKQRLNLLLHKTSDLVIKSCFLVMFVHYWYEAKWQPVMPYRQTAYLIL